MNPVNMPRNNSRTPKTQLTSRGLRNAPVKKTRAIIPARNSSADQRCSWRISSPPRMSKLMSSVDLYASLIICPCSGM